MQFYDGTGHRLLHQQNRSAAVALERAFSYLSIVCCAVALWYLLGLCDAVALWQCILFPQRICPEVADTWESGLSKCDTSFSFTSLSMAGPSHTFQTSRLF
jgi:hypothetical protein